MAKRESTPLEPSDDLMDLPAGIYYKPNINVIITQIRQCGEDAACIRRNADVVKQRYLAGGSEDRKRIRNEVIPLLESKAASLEDAVGLLDRGDKYMEFGETEKALEHYKNALEFNPLSVRALVGSARAHILLYEQEKEGRYLARNKQTHYYPALENLFLAKELAPWNLSAQFTYRSIKRLATKGPGLIERLSFLDLDDLALPLKSLFGGISLGMFGAGIGWVMADTTSHPIWSGKECYGIPTVELPECFYSTPTILQGYHPANVVLTALAFGAVATAIGIPLAYPAIKNRWAVIAAPFMGAGLLGWFLGIPYGWGWGGIGGGILGFIAGAIAGGISDSSKK